MLNCCCVQVIQLLMSCLLQRDGSEIKSICYNQNVLYDWLIILSINTHNVLYQYILNRYSQIRTYLTTRRHYAFNWQCNKNEQGTISNVFMILLLLQVLLLVLIINNQKKDEPPLNAYTHGGINVWCDVWNSVIKYLSDVKICYDAIKQ